MKAYCTALIFCIASAGAWAQSEPLSLVVTVEEAESNVGQVIVSLFTAENYLQDPTAEEVARVDEAGRAILVFPGLPPGEYAASVIYDEDMDGELDTGLFRIPTEKIGFSNNATSRFGPAPFEDAKFFLSSMNTAITINLASAR